MEQAIWKQRFAALNKMVSKCSFLFKSSTYINEIAKECPNKGTQKRCIWHAFDKLSQKCSEFVGVPNMWDDCIICRIIRINSKFSVNK